MKALAVRTAPRRGAAMVEMALILPLFLMIVLGIIEFGRAMMVGQLVTSAARDGARLAMYDGSTNSEVELYIKDFLESAATVNGTDVSVAITVTPAAGNPDPGNNVAAARTRDLITVQVQIPYDKIGYVMGRYLAGKKITAESNMRHE